MKKTNNLALSLALTSSLVGCGADNENNSIVKELEPELAQKYTQLVKIGTKEINGDTILTPCNISKVSIIDESIAQEYILGAKHCFGGVMDLYNGKDIVLFPEDDVDYKKYGLFYEEYKINDKNIKHTLDISDKNFNSISGEDLQIIGELKNQEDKTSIYYSIEGPAFQGNNGLIEMYINKNDQKFILQSINSDAKNLISFSGSPVIDREGKVFGVLIQNTNFDKNSDVITFRIQPLRAPDGTINHGKINK